MLYWRLIESHLTDPRIVISDGSREYTFHQLHARVRSYGAFFRSRGLKAGDRVLIVDREPLETVVLLLACISEGMVFVPVNRHTSMEERDEIIKSCSPALIIDSMEKPAGEAAPTCAEDRKKYPENTPVYIIYTSGSEGAPKGVCGSQKQILFCCDAINRRLGNNPNDRILCSLPLTFDYGLYQVFLAFLSGAQLYLSTGEVLQRIPYLLKKWQITALPTLPTMAALLVRTGFLKHADDFRLRYISFTGEVLPLSLIQTLREALPRTSVIPMYGMTECKRVSVMPAGRTDKVMAGSCGLPLDGVKVWLVNKEEETGIGELVVEGPNVMEGYWGIKDEDSGAFELDRETGKRRVYTGDIFRIDSEGFLYFCGRRNGIVKIRGYRVNGFRIEEMIRKVNGVKDVAVTGMPDWVTGEHVAIFVYADDDSVRMAVEETLRRMPFYLQNTEVFLLHIPFPRNRNGKTDLKKLCVMAREGLI